MKKPVILDLDGTLLNTITDLARSTDYALNKLGYPTHEIKKYNFIIENDTGKLFERVLPGGERSKENVLRVRKEFVPYYDIYNADDSRPYPDIPELPSYLQDASIQIAAASSRCQAATRKLISHYFSGVHFTVVFGQREGMKVKLDPTVAFGILEVAKATKEEVLYVDDSGVDIQTAADARVTACGVVQGFRPHAEPGELSLQYIVDTAEEIKRLIL